MFQLYRTLQLIRSDGLNLKGPEKVGLINEIIDSITPCQCQLRAGCMMNKIYFYNVYTTACRISWHN